MHLTKILRTLAGLEPKNMSEFIPFDDNVEVLGKAFYAIVKAFPVGEDVRKNILLKNGLDLNEGQWYPQQKFLSALKELASEVGDDMIEKSGELIPQHAAFPPEIQTLEQALKSIDVAYQMNHRNGDIGYYKLVAFNEENKQAIMECKNPYPSKFDLGLIKGMVRQFLPKTSFHYDVKIDESKECRSNSGQSCTYIITW